MNYFGSFGEIPEETKVRLTKQTDQLEKDFERNAAEEKIRRDTLAIRNVLSQNRWTDTGWGFIGDSYSTSSELLERINRVHRLNIQKHRPGRIAKGAITATGAVRRDSPIAAGFKAGVEEFDRQVSCTTCSIPFAPCPDKCKGSQASKYGKKLLIVGVVIAIIVTLAVLQPYVRLATQVF